MSNEPLVINAIELLTAYKKSDRRVEFYSYTPSGIRKPELFFITKILENGSVTIANDSQSNIVNFNNLIPMFGVGISHTHNPLGENSNVSFVKNPPVERMLELTIPSLFSQGSKQVHDTLFQLRKLFGKNTFMILHAPLITGIKDSKTWTYMFETSAHCLNARMFLQHNMNKGDIDIKILN